MRGGGEEGKAKEEEPLNKCIIRERVFWLWCCHRVGEERHQLPQRRKSNLPKTLLSSPSPHLLHTRWLCSVGGSCFGLSKRRASLREGGSLACISPHSPFNASPGDEAAAAAAADGGTESGEGARASGEGRWAGAMEKGHLVVDPESACERGEGNRRGVVAEWHGKKNRISDSFGICTDCAGLPGCAPRVACASGACCTAACYPTLAVRH